MHKSFGDVHALQGIGFSAPYGYVLGILGPNGAGKTTTIKVLSTLLRPDSGTARVAGFDVVKQAGDVRRSIMMTGQYASLDPMLTGRQNMELFGRLMGLRAGSARARAKELIEQFGLADAADRRVLTYSGGMRRRVDLACGLVVRPKVVFLDEPSTGLDPRSRQTVWDLVRSLREQGITVLLTTQYLEEADALSDRIIVIDRGRVIAEGTADELKNAAGGTHCYVVPEHLSDLPKVIRLLGDLVPQELARQTDGETTSLSIPAPNGSATLVEIIHRLGAEGVALADVGLRKPTLDDVFLSITGHYGK